MKRSNFNTMQARTKGSALARTRPFALAGFGSSLKGALQKASLKNLALLASPLLAARAGVAVRNPPSNSELQTKGKLQ
jgi:hypothetical protein